MDDVERIPIDLGYEVAAAGLEQAAQRTTLREDGTLVIDILASQPCSPEPSTEEEIVVCAAAPTDGRSPALASPPSPSPMEQLGEALHAKVGPVELGSIAGSDGNRAFGLRIRF